MHINKLIIASLKSEATQAELGELNMWRAASVDNEQHYQDFVMLWDLTQDGDDIAVRPPPTVDDIVGRDSLQQLGLVRLSGLSRPMPGVPYGTPSWHRWVPASAAAIGILALGAWMMAGLLSRPSGSPLALGADEFITGVAETATVALLDGTVIRLAPESRLRLSGERTARKVSLRGRAFFAVRSDSARPFRVETTAGSVEVLGTRFDLKAEDNRLRIAVVEGRVALSARGGTKEIQAGEIGQVVAGTALPAVKVPDPVTRADWMGKFLAFQETPLRDAVGEIQQLYGVQIEITDTNLASQTVTTWFADQPLEQVMTILCMVAEARCTILESLIKVEPRLGRTVDGPAR